LHIFVSISISTDDLESPGSDHNGRTNLTISFTVLLIRNRVFIPRSFQELTLHHTRISLRGFIHLDRVITTVEGKNECLVIEVLDLTKQSAVESKDELIFSKHLINILFGWLMIKTVHRSKGILLCSITSVRWDLNDELGGAFFFHWDRDLLNTEVLLVPGFGVGVAVID